MSGQTQDIDGPVPVLVQCWSDVLVTGIGSMLVFAGINITSLCENRLFFGCLVQHIYLITSIIFWDDL